MPPFPESNLIPARDQLFYILSRPAIRSLQPTTAPLPSVQRRQRPEDHGEPVRPDGHHRQRHLRLHPVQQRRRAGARHAVPQRHSASQWEPGMLMDSDLVRMSTILAQF